MTKSLINMERSYAFYAGGLGVVMVFSLLLSNVPELSFSQFFDFAHRRKVSAGLFMAGAVFGAWAVSRHMSRSKTPWAVPQSQITIPYLGFLICSLIALVLSH
jgi:hypothetical protein